MPGSFSNRGNTRQPNLKDFVAPHPKGDGTGPALWAFGAR